MRKLKPMIMVLCFLLLLNSCTFNNEKEPLESTLEESHLSIVENGNTEYVIVTPTDIGAELESAVSAFKKLVKSKTGVSLRMINDYLTEEEGAGEKKEILIGKTNRAASVSLFSTLKCNDYIVSSKGNQLVILGGSDAATILALERFGEELFSGDASGNMIVSEKNLFELKNSYAIDVLSINGIDISEYRIVYPKDSVYLKNSAERLWTAVATCAGVDLEVVDDASGNPNGKREILIGNTNRTVLAEEIEENQIQYRVSDMSIQIVGGCINDTTRGVDSFINEYLSKTGTVSLSLSNGQIIQLGQDSSYTVMSFNVLYSDRENRVELVAEAIRSVLPDSVGLQEDNDSWLMLLEPRLKDLYARVGTDVTEPADKYHNAIFYRKDRFECIESDTLWLSQNPTLMYSKFESSKYCRIVTYAVLKDKQSGEIYVHYNTHLDINRDGATKQLEVLQEITSKCQYPYVVTGDFNINPTWKEYGFMQKTWLDSRTVAEKSTDDWTDVAGILDYCMVSSSVIASEFVVLNSPYILKQDYENGNLQGQSYYLSDHYPVYVKFNLDVQ